MLKALVSEKTFTEQVQALTVDLRVATVQILILERALAKANETIRTAEASESYKLLCARSKAGY